MFKLNAFVLCALAVCVVADLIRQKPLGRRVSARQQLQPTPATPTGYPAAGVTPQIPFNLPNEPENPFVVVSDDVTPQPDEVYGPPEFNGQPPVQPEIVALPPGEVYGAPEGEPDEVYGPPEFETGVPQIVREIAEDIDDELNDVAEDLDEVIIDEDNDADAVISVSSTFAKPARLVYQRFPQSRQAPKPVPARLIAAKIVKPTNFIYTARFIPQLPKK